MYTIVALFVGTLFAVAHAQQPRICPSTHDPVCATNGLTHKNRCILRHVNSIAPGIIIAHDGFCESDPKGVAQRCMCTLDYKPVCAVDGKTYPNKCLAQCINAEDPNFDDEKRMIDGICEGNSNMHCICQHEFDPVCGPHGVTYPNQCALDCASSKDPSIKKIKDGTCEGENPLCKCTRELNPVCGSDGEYYQNQCELDCFSSVDPTIKIVENKICDDAKNRTCDCTSEYKPVCGTNYITYTNRCMLDCVNSEDPRITLSKEGDCLQNKEYSKDYSDFV